MPYLRVWFYDPVGDSQGLVNKLVARLDPPYCHTELQFSNNVSCSVYMGSSVTLRERSFESHNYTCVSLPCTPQQETLARTRAQQCFNDKQSFSTFHMSTCFLGSDTFDDPSKTFCSKLVYEILHHAGLVSGTVRGGGVSPSALYRMLNTNKQIKDTTSVVKSIAIGFKTQ